MEACSNLTLTKDLNNMERMEKSRELYLMKPKLLKVILIIFVMWLMEESGYQK